MGEGHEVGELKFMTALCYSPMFCGIREQALSESNGRMGGTGGGAEREGQRVDRNREASGGDRARSAGEKGRGSEKKRNLI